MLQDTTLSTTVSTELTTSLQQTFSGEKLRTLEQQVSLPTDRNTFLWFLLSTLLICSGLMLYVLLSVQIFHIETQLTTLQKEYQTIERQNTDLVWEIAQQASLGQLQQRANALGYTVPQTRLYVPIPPATSASAPTSIQQEAAVRASTER
jgi:cell division protein FtsL